MVLFKRFRFKGTVQRDGSGRKYRFVRSLSVSFFIEKEPHNQPRMKRKRKGERRRKRHSTSTVHVNQASKHPCLRALIKASQIA
jgi:hypothetical protein